jgi:hypothetical protein
MVDEAREPEVPQLGVERRVKHYVARLDVPVHNTLLPLLVQVRQRRPEAKNDLVPVHVMSEGEYQK